MLLTAALLPQASVAQVPACTGNGADCTVVVAERHAVTRLEYWRSALARPIEQRMGPASAELLDYITQDNIRNSVPNRPRPPVLAPDFLAEVRAVLAELPAQVRRLLSARLAGIYFAEDFGGTGYTDEIVDADSKAVAGFVLLDSALLGGLTANAWATWKENTPFQPQSAFKLVAEIEEKPQDNRKNAIQYILLHELGHVLSIGQKIHPPWTTEPRDVDSADGYPYFLLSWSSVKDENRYATKFDRSFAQRRDVVYYFGAKLPAAQMLDVYGKLESTNFPTLYAATQPGDDWAEAFASYVHTVLMNKPFEIRIYRDGALAKTYRSCWSQARCAEKRKILERFLGMQ